MIYFLIQFQNYLFISLSVVGGMLLLIYFKFAIVSFYVLISHSYSTSQINVSCCSWWIFLLKFYKWYH